MKKFDEPVGRKVYGNFFKDGYFEGRESGSIIPPAYGYYVIPEKELIDHGYIGKKQKLFVSPTNQNTEWCNKYLVEYDNIDKERLFKIVNL